MSLLKKEQWHSLYNTAFKSEIFLLSIIAEDLQCNLTHVYSDISPSKFSGTYLGVNVSEIAASKDLDISFEVNRCAIIL